MVPVLYVVINSLHRAKAEAKKQEASVMTVKKLILLVLTDALANNYALVEFTFK